MRKNALIFLTDQTTYALAENKDIFNTERIIGNIQSFTNLLASKLLNIFRIMTLWPETNV